MPKILCWMLKPFEFFKAIKAIWTARTFADPSDLELPVADSWVPPVAPGRRISDQLLVTLDSSASGGKMYSLMVTNTGGEAAHNLELHYAQLLRPDYFGVDQTHMPTDIWNKLPIQIPTLEAQESRIFEVEGWAEREFYDGPIEASMPLTIGNQRGGDQKHQRHWVMVEVCMPSVRSELMGWEELTKTRKAQMKRRTRMPGSPSASEAPPP